MKKRIIIISLLIVLSFMFILYNVFLRDDNSISYAISKYGSRSDEVKQIQTKLKRWGYYNGEIDGIFGTKTLNAVKYFQSKNGLTVDRNCRRKNSSGYGYIFF